MPHWKPKSNVEFRQLADDLWLFGGRDPASRRGKLYYCYLIGTSAGNLMLHPPDSPAFYSDQQATIDALGGVKHIVMTHTGDVNIGWGVAWRTWRPALHGHAADIAALPAAARVLPFTALTEHFADHEVVHLPGHTEGYVALIGKHGPHRYLFSGHLMVQGVLGWRSTTRARLAESGRRSIAAFEGFDVDYLMPEYVWQGDLPAGSAPVAFDKDVRRTAVRQALTALGARKA